MNKKGEGSMLKEVCGIGEVGWMKYMLAGEVEAWKEKRKLEPYLPITCSLIS